MRLLFIIFLLIQTNLMSDIIGNDYFGRIKTAKFLASDTIVLFDFDGDRIKDTLLIHFMQTVYTLRIKSHKDEELLTCAEESSYIELARVFLVNDEKPLLIIGVEKFSEYYEYCFYIYDIIHTVRGIEALLLLSDTLWIISSIILKPNYIEIKDFRGGTISKYLWDGEKFIKVYDINSEYHYQQNTNELFPILAKRKLEDWQKDYQNMLKDIEKFQRRYDLVRSKIANPTTEESNIMSQIDAKIREWKAETEKFNELQTEEDRTAWWDRVTKLRREVRKLLRDLRKGVNED